MSDLLQKLQWRYATKKMNPAKRVPEEKYKAATGECVWSATEKKAK